MGTAACDLVLLGWNQLECTRPCVESILAHTQVPARLIIVDQASEEETVSYLKSLRSTPAVEIEILWNPKNVGYPKGMNLGLTKAAAPYVCFLNNDILVPPGWLEELIAVAESDPSIGLVNPSSNTFNLYPPKGTGWLEFAKDLSKKRGQWTEVSYGEGFCLLGRREVLVKVGGFDDTTYDQIYFEDADLSRKIHALGLKSVMAEGTYVWHEGGRTTSQRPERARFFQENEHRFLAKWGAKSQRILYAVESGVVEALTQISEQARLEANRFGQIWIFTDSSPATKNLPRHADIRVWRFPRWQIPWAVLWMALFKKKKFERIVTDSNWVRRALNWFRFLHRASVESLPPRETRGFPSSGRGGMLGEM